MATVELTRRDFGEVLKAEGTPIVDSWASWCGPCKAIALVFEAASEQHPKVVLVTVDTGTQFEPANSFGIQSIPTRMIFRDEVPVFPRPAALSARAFEEQITHAGSTRHG